MTRLEALCKALGWQGGTIHQVAAETGCPADDLLSARPKNVNLGSDYSAGWFAGRTCSLQYNLTVNFPKRKGNLEYWLGVAMGLIMESKCHPLIVPRESGE
jgi:hypothetical protein